MPRRPRAARRARARPRPAPPRRRPRRSRSATPPSAPTASGVSRSARSSVVGRHAVRDAAAPGRARAPRTSAAAPTAQPVDRARVRVALDDHLARPGARARGSATWLPCEAPLIRNQVRLRAPRLGGQLLRLAGTASARRPTSMPVRERRDVERERALAERLERARGPRPGRPCGRARGSGPARGRRRRAARRDRARPTGRGRAVPASLGADGASSVSRRLDAPPASPRRAAAHHAASMSQLPMPTTGLPAFSASAISDSVPQPPPTATSASAARTTSAFRASPSRWGSRRPRTRSPRRGRGRAGCRWSCRRPPSRRGRPPPSPRRARRRRSPRPPRRAGAPTVLGGTEVAAVAAGPTTATWIRAAAAAETRTGSSARRPGPAEPAGRSRARGGRARGGRARGGRARRILRGGPVGRDGRPAAARLDRDRDPGRGQHGARQHEHRPPEAEPEARALVQVDPGQRMVDRLAAHDDARLPRPPRARFRAAAACGAGRARSRARRA